MRARLGIYNATISRLKFQISICRFYRFTPKRYFRPLYLFAEQTNGTSAIRLSFLSVGIFLSDLRDPDTDTSKE